MSDNSEQKKDENIGATEEHMKIKQVHESPVNKEEQEKCNERQSDESCLGKEHDESCQDEKHEQECELEGEGKDKKPQMQPKKKAS